MRAARAVVAIAIVAVIALVCWYAFFQSSPSSGPLAIYYTTMDGSTLGRWSISTRAREPGETASQYLLYEVKYAAVQDVAGPPNAVQAVRFPPGTRAIGVALRGSVAYVDLSSEVTQQAGTFGENAQFKALVYTLTALPGVDAVQVLVAGRRLQTLPHGSLEIDAPLRRADW